MTKIIFSENVDNNNIINVVVVVDNQVIVITSLEKARWGGDPRVVRRLITARALPRSSLVLPHHAMFEAAPAVSGRELWISIGACKAQFPGPTHFIVASNHALGPDKGRPNRQRSFLHATTS